MSNPYAIARDYAESIMEEKEHWWNEELDQLLDVCHQWADQSEHVIYYSNAHDFVRGLDGSDESNAVDHCHYSGLMPESYDDWAVKIAYFALVELIQQYVFELLDEEEAA